MAQVERVLAPDRRRLTGTGFGAPGVVEARDGPPAAPGWVLALHLGQGGLVVVLAGHGGYSLTVRRTYARMFAAPVTSWRPVIGSAHDHQ
jgi:hypothetical protein